jgi:hypothetical protein
MVDDALQSACLSLTNLASRSEECNRRCSGTLPDEAPSSVHVQAISLPYQYPPRRRLLSRGNSSCHLLRRLEARLGCNEVLHCLCMCAVFYLEWILDSLDMAGRGRHSIRGFQGRTAQGAHPEIWRGFCADLSLAVDATVFCEETRAGLQSESTV